MVTALVCGMATAAYAEKTFDVSTGLVGGVIDGGGIAGPGNYTTGFEAPFAPGAVEPQQGWTATHVNDVWASVSTANPNAGLQHLRMQKQNPGGAPGGGNRVALGPTLGAQPAGASTLSMNIFIDATGGADYDIVPQAPSQGFLTARVKFFFGDADADLIPGDILVLDDADGPGPGGLAFIATGAEYTVGAYKNLRVEANSITDSLQYFYDGALIYTAPFGLFAGTSMEQIAVLSDNFQTNTVEHADIDNIAITPEPASLLALGTLGLVALRRRR
jgi:hypothetical protein